MQEAVLREQVFNCPLLAGWDSIFNSTITFHVTYVELLNFYSERIQLDHTTFPRYLYSCLACF